MDRAGGGGAVVEGMVWLGLRLREGGAIRGSVGEPGRARHARIGGTCVPSHSSTNRKRRTVVGRTIAVVFRESQTPSRRWDKRRRRRNITRRLCSRDILSCGCADWKNTKKSTHHTKRCKVHSSARRGWHPGLRFRWSRPCLQTRARHLQS